MLEIIAILASEVCFQSPQAAECQAWIHECMFTQPAETLEALVEQCTQEVPANLLEGGS